MSMLGRRALMASALDVDWWLSGGISAANAVAVYQPKGVGSLALSYVDLSGNGNDAAPGTAPTFATGTGWTFNGSSQFLTTPITPNSSYSIIVRYSDTANNGYVCGEYDNAVNRGFLSMAPSSGAVAGASRFLSDRELDAGTEQATGVVAIAGRIAYIDGASVGTCVLDSHTPTTVHIGGLHFRTTGLTLLHYSGSVQAVAIYNTTLTGDQVAAVTTAAAAL